MTTPRPQEVLSRMDQAATALRTATKLVWSGKRATFAGAFPTLANDRLDLASSRLAGYRLGDWWAITVESFGFSDLYEPGGSMFPVWVQTLSPSPEVWLDAWYPVQVRDLFSEHGEVNSLAECYVRGERVDVSAVLALRPPVVAQSSAGILSSLAFLLGRSPRAGERPPPDGAEVARLLVAHSGKRLLATEAERRGRRIPQRAELVIELDEWYHPNVESELPSEVESMVQLSRVLATGDAGQYRPTRPPNSHWENWVLVRACCSGPATFLAQVPHPKVHRRRHPTTRHTHPIVDDGRAVAQTPPHS